MSASHVCVYAQKEWLWDNIKLIWSMILTYKLLPIFTVCSSMIVLILSNAHIYFSAIRINRRLVAMWIESWLILFFLLFRSSCARFELLEPAVTSAVLSLDATLGARIRFPTETEETPSICSTLLPTTFNSNASRPSDRFRAPAYDQYESEMDESNTPRCVWILTDVRAEKRGKSYGAYRYWLKRKSLQWVSLCFQPCWPPVPRGSFWQHRGILAARQNLCVVIFYYCNDEFAYRLPNH